MSSFHNGTNESTLQLLKNTYKSINISKTFPSRNPLWKKYFHNRLFF